MEDSGRKSGAFSLADAQLLIASEHGFANWTKFEEHLKAIVDARSVVSQFESAADAVITGDAKTLERLLHENPELARARSTREHQATLLHCVSANGVEDFRQKTPRNAVEIARTLLRAGAEVDAKTIRAAAHNLPVLPEASLSDPIHPACHAA